MEPPPSSPPPRPVKREPLDPEAGEFPGQDSTEAPELMLGRSLAWGTPKEHPLMAPGGRKYSDHCEERASRPGKSRIPGRDHRRYYHEHWRAEYLMDFNPARHGMICMVCGSALATLKLSTIKRHIRQKHPYSGDWGPREKQVIIQSWDAHLGLDGELEGHGDPAQAPDSLQGAQGMLSAGGGFWRRHCAPCPSPRGAARRPVVGGRKASPSTHRLECYVRESLQSWFQAEFLMDYDAQGNRLRCMMCGRGLPSLNLDDIKRHVLQAHPTSLAFSPAEKGAILEAWNSRALVLAAGKGWVPQEEHPAGDSQNPLQPSSPEELDEDVQLPAEGEEEESVLVVGTPPYTPQSPSDPIAGPPTGPALAPRREQRRNYQLHWRVEYLMDYDGRRHGLVCMVCGGALATLKVSTIKRHILQVHPFSLDFTLEERQTILEAYNETALHYEPALGEESEVKPYPFLQATPADGEEAELACVPPTSTA